MIKFLFFLTFILSMGLGGLLFGVGFWLGLHWDVIEKDK